MLTPRPTPHNLMQSYHPITLSFDLGRISGNSGYNHYHGPATLSPTENTFNTSFVGGTRRRRVLCFGCWDTFWALGYDECSDCR
mmetsp:Transcript_25218/g.45394  ORF Transcript_25218/g.45394 Transcript_25218/m.45394 type:complete len:84 (+) Transcript_25218:988-1239(+)